MNCNKNFMFFMKKLLIKMIYGLGRHPLVFEMHPSQWCILNVAPIAPIGTIVMTKGDKVYVNRG